jgi:anti-anti-sigma factor
MGRLAGGREWTVDLAAVRFIDSTGLGLLVRLRKLCQKNKQTVHFTNLQPAIRNVLRIAQLEEFLLGITSQIGVWRSDPMSELGETTARAEPAATR